MELLQTVCGVVNPAQFITFESQVVLGHTSFIDAYIPETKVMIEQKSKDIDLTKPAKQSDGSMLTSYQQAKRYSDELELSKKPRYIVVCNFQEFHIHDMEHPHDEPEVLKLADLPKEYYRLSFLTDTHKAHLKREMELSIKAGEIVGQIYDAILKHYHDPSAEILRQHYRRERIADRLEYCYSKRETPLHHGQSAVCGIFFAISGTESGYAQYLCR